MAGQDRTGRFTRSLASARALVSGPQMLAFLPALCLAAYWVVGEGGLLVTALVLPLLWAALGLFTRDRPAPYAAPGPAPGTALEHYLANHLANAGTGGRLAVFAVGLDDAAEFCAKHDGGTLEDIHDQILLRLRSVLRDGDLVVPMERCQWVVALAPGPRLNLEAAIQHAGRLQAEVDAPIFVGANRFYLSASVGFTMDGQIPNAAPKDLIAQAVAALQVAAAQGPASVRLFAPTAAPPVHSTPGDLPDLGDADIAAATIAWFQPQISTDTGDVSGFEALARWRHPNRGLLAPAAFLPQLHRMGQMERLSEVMLQQGLQALAHWDSEDLTISTVGVNFSEQDLANPKLYDKIAWDLDRFGIAPHRLCIEILEGVIAGDCDDVIARNVTRLSDLGCQIDLDDFGTGHASISSLRRLPIQRLKIDRTFIAKADLDPDQQQMLGTILLMADRLGLSCLAEGVETLGEHAIVAQLGCRYVQGYGIAKPMPLQDTAAWVRDYQSRVSAAPQIGRNAR